MRLCSQSQCVIILIVREKKSHTQLEPPLFHVEAVVSSSPTKAASVCPVAYFALWEAAHWVCSKLPLLHSELGHVPQTPHTHPVLQPVPVLTFGRFLLLFLNFSIKL